jgi:hypothetical protein
MIYSRSLITDVRFYCCYILLIYLFSCFSRQTNVLFASPHHNTRQQIDYIKKINLDVDDQRTIIVEIGFSENHNLIVQHEIQQTHYNTNQATIFTINIRVNNKIHHSMAVVT